MAEKSSEALKIPDISGGIFVAGKNIRRLDGANLLY
jgi:hypothetical protein